MPYENDSMEFDWQYQTGVSMADVGGMGELKEQLHKEIVRPLTTDREKAAKLGITAPNVLFHGPPGTGKTYIAKALATELGLPFVKLSGSDIKSQWINQSAQQIQQLFTEAETQAKQEGGALIFIDELDSVLSKRGSSEQHEEDNKVVNEFLNHLEETKEHGVVFVGATNRLAQLDEAATRSGRIDRKIEIGLPDASARAHILDAQLKQRSYKIADDNVETIAENAAEYSAADIEGLVQDAARNAAFERDADVITIKDIGAVEPALTDGTDTSLPASELSPDDSQGDHESHTEQPGQPQTFESRYRVVGFGDGAQRMLLYDIPRNDTVWVNTTGCAEAVRSVIEEIEYGNVVEAAVTDPGSADEYWTVLDIKIVDDTVLYFVPTDGYTPGPTDDIWEYREDGDDVLTAGRDDQETGELLYELQLQAKHIEFDDGKSYEVYDALQRGELLTERFFDGTNCDYLTGGAKCVIVVNPMDKAYLALYIFPEKSEKFEEIWGALYDFAIGEA